MSWELPTGHNDPDTNWDGETHAYDGNIVSYAYTYTQDADLEFTHASIQCDKIRIYARRAFDTSYDPTVDIDVHYSGGWHNIYSGTITKDVWVEKHIGSVENVTAARVSCSDVLFGGGLPCEFRINEFEFHKYETPGSYAGQGYPYAWPLGWYPYKGQTVNFNFFPKVTVAADICLLKETAKSFMADVIVAPPFDIKNIPADILLQGEKEKTIPADLLLLEEKAESVTADIILHAPYTPDDELEDEQKKDSYVPYVELWEVE